MNQQLLDAIAPANGAKYSPNLHKWLTRSQDTKRSSFFGPIRVWRSFESGHERIYIGWLNKEGWFSGCQIGSVLSSKWRDIPKPEILAYGNPEKCGWVEIADFWEQYQAKGRCVLDFDHSAQFVSGEQRFLTDGDTRICKWCGVVQNLKRWQETVERQKWEVVTP